MAVNEVLLRQVMSEIRQNLGRWNQASYATKYTTRTDCHTTYCLAGWTYLLGAGDPLAVSADRIHDVAATMLGLTEEQSDDLFDFTDVFDPARGRVHPTFEQFAHHVADVTGVDVLARPERKAVHPNGKPFNGGRTPATSAAVPSRESACVGG